VDRGLSQVMPAQVLKELEPSNWARLSAGKGSKGPRLYDWARMKLNSYQAPLQRGLLFRRSLADEMEVAFYIAHAPEPTALEAMMLAAGQRWPVEECFESAKGEVRLGDDEVRTYAGWYPQMTLCLVASRSWRPPESWRMSRRQRCAQKCWPCLAAAIRWNDSAGARTGPHPHPPLTPRSPAPDRAFGVRHRPQHGVHPALEPLAAPPSGHRQALSLPTQSPSGPSPSVVPVTICGHI
jgi:hypothetical protein